MPFESRMRGRDPKDGYDLAAALGKTGMCMRGDLALMAMARP